MKTDNELIAEFMGINVAYFGEILYLSDEDGWVDLSDDSVPYWPHKSWDQLMPVVEKIGDVWSKFANDNKIEPDDYPLQIRMMRIYLAWAKMPETYKAVLEFIKWYNKTNLKE